MTFVISLLCKLNNHSIKLRLCIPTDDINCLCNDNVIKLISQLHEEISNLVKYI